MAGKKSLLGYVGEWKLSKGKPGVCPEKFEISSSGKNKIKVKNIRKYAVGEVQFDLNKTLVNSSSKKMDKDKDPDGLIQKTYTLKTVVNSSIENGILVSSHLWSSPDFGYLSTGLKTLSLTSGTLKLDKVVTGFMPDKDRDSVSASLRKKYFSYPNNYSINSASFSCEFLKMKK